MGVFTLKTCASFCTSLVSCFNKLAVLPAAPAILDIRMGWHMFTMFGEQLSSQKSYKNARRVVCEWWVESAAVNQTPDSQSQGAHRTLVQSVSRVHIFTV